MKKLKWKYSDKFIDYGTEQWSAAKFIIERDSNTTYLFNKKHEDLIAKFKKLSSAKKVAQLIYNG